MPCPWDEPFVSFITPAYNGEQYIAETIQSVQNQTFGKFELIIVDDESSDRTLEIAKLYAACDGRLRVVGRSNGGAAAARNTAIRLGRAEYFTLLDADDVLLPGYAAEQLAILAAQPEIDILSGNMINFGGSSNGTPIKPVSGGVREISLGELIAVEDSVCILSTIRRRVFDRVGGFDERLRTNEDYDFWLRAACAGCRIFFNPQPLAYYRRRPGSMSANEPMMLAGIVAVLAKTRPLLTGRSDELSALDRQIQRFGRRRQLVLASSSLERGDFAEVADDFQMLYETTGGYLHHGLAKLARHAPRLLRLGYSARKSWRTCRRIRLKPRLPSGSV